MTGVMRVLVVDDDLWSRRLVTEVLEERGLLVDAVGDMVEARARLAELASVSLVVLDIHLPGGNGVTLLAEIRARAHELPVIAVTAAAMAGDRERFLALGFTGYMSKPIDVATFGEEIEGYLAKTPSVGSQVGESA